MTTTQNWSGHFRSNGHQFLGNSFSTGGGPLYFTVKADTEPSSCLHKLLVTDPRVERRILNGRGDIIHGCCSWVSRSVEFTEWWNQERIQILWIHGGPGKGKTMMSMFLITEVRNLLETSSGTMVYFFCQRDIKELSNGVSILRGLIYVLVDKHRALYCFLEKAYQNEGGRLFEGIYGMHALWRLLCDMLQAKILPRVVLLIDALDECNLYQAEFLNLLTKANQKFPPTVKWIITSRNEPQIMQDLQMVSLVRNISLELNWHHISTAVQEFIDFKTEGLKNSKGYSDSLYNTVKQHLSANANGTFLWVALVCKALEKTHLAKTMKTLKEFPPGLHSLYESMMDRIAQLDDNELSTDCFKILRASTMAYRRLHLSEYAFAAELSDEYKIQINAIKELIGFCGSFLAIQNNVVYFVHESARDYLTGLGNTRIFPFGLLQEHKMMGHRSLQLISSSLRRDICQIHDPGIFMNDVDIQHINKHLPSHVMYACTFWIPHILFHSPSLVTDCMGSKDILLKFDIDVITKFLKHDFLHWLEALAWMGKISDGIIAMRTLESYITRVDKALSEVVYDAIRFMLAHRFILDIAPLQTYSSALLFSPLNSLIRKTYSNQLQELSMVGPVDGEWSSCLQTLQGHYDAVESVVFSPDGQILASASSDHTIHLWNIRTGESFRQLNGHSDIVRAVVFSPIQPILASGSEDKSIRLWDISSGKLLRQLNGHKGFVFSVTFSSDGRLVISSSSDNTLRVWDVETGKPCGILLDHSGWLKSLDTENRSISPDVINLWNIQTGGPCGQLRGHFGKVRSVAFSFDGRIAASGTFSQTIDLWNVQTGQSCGKLEGHMDRVRSVVFSHDGDLIISGSDDKTIRVWDAHTCESKAQLEGHLGFVLSVALSPNGRLLASGSADTSIKVWDLNTNANRSIYDQPNGRSNRIRCLAISPDGHLVASGSEEYVIRLWNVQNGTSIGQIECYYSGPTTCLTFSLDGELMASASDHGIVQLWDVQTGQTYAIIQTNSGPIWSLVFSPDGKLIASRSTDNILRIWNVTNGVEIASYYSTDYTYPFTIYDDHLLKIPDNTTSASCSSSSSLPSPSGPIWPNSSSSLSINAEGDWILSSGKRFLWIPPEKRSSYHVFYENTVIFGTSADRVYILKVG